MCDASVRLKTAKVVDEIHSGEILLEDFMKPMGITARRLAADIDVPPSRISDVLNGRRPVTANTALRPGYLRCHGPAWPHAGSTTVWLLESVFSSRHRFEERRSYPGHAIQLADVERQRHLTLRSTPGPG